MEFDEFVAQTRWNYNYLTKTIIPISKNIAQIPESI